MTGGCEEDLGGVAQHAGHAFCSILQRVRRKQPVGGRHPCGR